MTPALSGPMADVVAFAMPAGMACDAARGVAATTPVAWMQTVGAWGLGRGRGGALCASLRLAETVSDAHIVTIICDRGDCYLTTEVFGKT